MFAGMLPIGPIPTMYPARTDDGLNFGSFNDSDLAGDVTGRMLMEGEPDGIRETDMGDWIPGATPYASCAVVGREKSIGYDMDLAAVSLCCWRCSSFFKSSKFRMICNKLH